MVRDGARDRAVENLILVIVPVLLLLKLLLFEILRDIAVAEIKNSLLRLLTARARTFLRGRAMARARMVVRVAYRGVHAGRRRAERRANRVGAQIGLGRGVRGRASLVVASLGERRFEYVFELYRE